MEIYIHVRKEVMGRSITVSVLAFSGQLISSVSASLDDSLLGDCTLAFPQVSYMRTWHWASGGSSVGSHRVVVTATDQKGRGEMASKKWSD